MVDVTLNCQLNLENGLSAGYQRSKQMDKRYKISFFTLAVSLCFVTLSWSFFNWLPTYYIVTYMAGYLVFVLLLSWIASRSWLKSCCLMTSGGGLTVYCLLIVMLIIVAPVNSYFYAIRLARNFVLEAEVDARMERQDILVYDSMFHRHIGRPSAEPYRSVTTVYRVLEPVEQVQAKLRSRLRHVRGWQYEDAKGEVIFEASCTFSNIPVTHSVLLYSDGALKILLEYGYPSYCSLG